MNNLSNTKKILLAIFILIVVGAIWYLQSLKVQPGGGVAGTSSNIAFSSSTVLASSSTASLSFDGSSSIASLQVALQSLARSDQSKGYVPAREIVDPTGFVNASSNFKLADLIGKKVILLDFWTYSCINCIRTIPHLNAWYQAYATSGLEIVGIHTPEFDFEKQINNVRAAVKQYGIPYPIILDSNYSTWNAYGNLYWPEEYLIDMAGYVVHQNIGEGDYDGTESEIQSLLKQRAMILGLSEPQFSSSAPVNAQTPSGGSMSSETYFGAARNDFLANGTQHAFGTQQLVVPTNLSPDSLYLGGAWNFNDQYASVAAPDAKVVYEYQAAKVFFVAASPTGASTTIQVLQDGKPLPASEAGSDVKNGILTVGPSRLYNVVSNPDGSGVHTLEFIINSPGLQAYTFTFG